MVALKILGWSRHETWGTWRDDGGRFFIAPLGRGFVLSMKVCEDPKAYTILMRGSLRACKAHAGKVASGAAAVVVPEVYKRNRKKV